ncbi:GntR family transcriptional regulator [Vulgatibacter incomptus]|uniref:Transcriptional regulator, GntR family n=1 Tax=Vulgatibacter incomptus TaxID=1391653 RepID=A0A0K1PBI1_9BACT|nr:GntR family transcriptional regulator [Vulgatibacter incomptus]AKU90761.1 Transcriptional regulator, GntR family [Vulgatibacter incomptus]
MDNLQPAPILHVDLDDPVPAYRQIANQIRALLVAGSFRPDDRLPTVRQLAMDLGVHHNTVAEAYRILAGEGWIESRRRHGVTVLRRSAPRATEESRLAFSSRLRELVAEAVANGLSLEEIAGELGAQARRITE